VNTRMGGTASLAFLGLEYIVPLFRGRRICLDISNLGGERLAHWSLLWIRPFSTWPDAIGQGAGLARSGCDCIWSVAFSARVIEEVPGRGVP
jgi:hypothetical protein